MIWAASLADRIDDPEDDVVNSAFAEIIALLECPQRRGRQRHRGHFVQCSVGLAAAARRANVIVDIGLRHNALLV
jgi:hypothetical protein